MGRREVGVEVVPGSALRCKIMVQQWRRFTSTYRFDKPMRSPGQMELSCHGTLSSPAPAGTHRGEPKRAWYPVVFGGNVLHPKKELKIRLHPLSERVKMSRAASVARLICTKW